MAVASFVSNVLCLCKFAFTFENILRRLVVDKVLDICISEDNQACIKKAENPVLAHHTKHVNLKYHFFFCQKNS